MSAPQPPSVTGEWPVATVVAVVRALIGTKDVATVKEEISR